MSPTLYWPLITHHKKWEGASRGVHKQVAQDWKAEKKQNYPWGRLSKGQIAAFFYLSKIYGDLLALTPSVMFHHVGTGNDFPMPACSGVFLPSHAGRCQ